MKNSYPKEKGIKCYDMATGLAPSDSAVSEKHLKFGRFLFSSSIRFKCSSVGFSIYSVHNN